MTRLGRAASAVAGKPRALAGRMRLGAATAARSARERARGESRRRRVGWLAVVVLLVAGPLAFNLARAPGFEAEVLLFPREVRPYPAIGDPRYYSSFLADPELRLQMRLNVGEGLADYEDVTVRRVPGRARLRLVVEADDPRNAQRFVDALAPQIANAARRQLARAAARDAKAVNDRLLTAPPGAERRRLRGRSRRLARLRDAPPLRVVPGVAASLPRMERWADRLVDDLPGDFSPRPNPAWAALAGLLVAATLWGIGLMLVPPRRS